MTHKQNFSRIFAHLLIGKQAVYPKSGQEAFAGIFFCLSQSHMQRKMGNSAKHLSAT